MLRPSWVLCLGVLLWTTSLAEEIVNNEKEVAEVEEDVGTDNDGRIIEEEDGTAREGRIFEEEDSTIREPPTFEKKDGTARQGRIFEEEDGTIREPPTFEEEDGTPREGRDFEKFVEQFLRHAQTEFHKRSENSRPQQRSDTPRPHFDINKDVFKTSGKNVMGMMKKIEDLLKEGIKPADPTSNRQSFPSKIPGNKRPLQRRPQRPPPLGYRPEPPQGGKDGSGYGTQENYIESYPNLEVVEKEHDRFPIPDLSLGLEDYKRIWLNMLYSVYKILQDDNLLRESVTSTKTLEKIFYLLQDVNLLEYRQNKKKEKCPYSYDKAGSLCLSGEFIHETLSWEDARLFCQTVKGGDLVIFKNACEFHDALKYIRKIDPEKSHSYWFGATDLDTEGIWKYVDGTIVHLGAPFWGQRLGNLEPSDSPLGQDYGILLNTDNYYMHDVNNALAVKKLNVLPLCQYIPQRDGYIFHPKKPKGWGPYNSMKGENKFNFYGIDKHGYGTDGAGSVGYEGGGYGGGGGSYGGGGTGGVGGSGPYQGGTSGGGTDTSFGPDDNDEYDPLASLFGGGEPTRKEGGASLSDFLAL